MSVPTANWSYPTAVRFLEMHHHASYLDEKSRELEAIALAPALAALQNAIHRQAVKDLPPRNFSATQPRDAGV